MNPRYKFGVWLGVRNISAECFVGTAEGVFRARELRRLEQQNRWDNAAINNVIGVPWRIVDGKWTVDKKTIQIDPLPPPPMPFEGARVQSRADIAAFGTTAGCPGFNVTPEGAERLDRRGEVLNEAFAKEAERSVRRREETGSAAGELAVPRESKDAPIPPDPDSGRRRAMKAATVDASSSGLQMGGSRAVGDESRMDVNGEERDEPSSSKAQNIRRRIVTKTSTEESRMDDEGEEEDEFRSSTVPNTRRRIVTKTPLEENKTKVTRERGSDHPRVVGWDP